MITISIFTSSLSIVLILIGLKAYELKSGNQHIVAGLIRKLDDRSVKLFSTIRYRCVQIIQTLRYLFLVKVKNFIEDQITDLYVKVKSELQKQENTFMGRKDISNKGAVSFFLKKIKDEKTSINKGKIE